MTRPGERGSAGIWAVAVVGALLTVSLGVLAWSGALVARQRAQNAADLAALAAARHAVSGGEGCAAAGRLVSAAGGRLLGCTVHDGAVVTVLVEVPVPLVRGLEIPPARARARAGPTP